MVEDHCIAKLKPKHGLINCYLVKPIFAEDTVGEFGGGGGKAVVVKLVVINNAEFANRRDRVEAEWV